jgi:hypothetical protein
MPIDLLFSTPNSFLMIIPAAALENLPNYYGRFESWSSTQLQLSCSTYMQYFHAVSGLKRFDENWWDTRWPPAGDHAGRPEFKTVGISFVVDVTVCPKAGCDVGCFPLCWEAWKKAALLCLGCVDGKGCTGNGCMGEGRGLGACVQPLEVCHQSDLLLGPSFRLGPLPWPLE